MPLVTWAGWGVAGSSNDYLESARYSQFFIKLQSKNIKKYSLDIMKISRLNNLLKVLLAKYQSIMSMSI